MSTLETDGDNLLCCVLQGTIKKPLQKRQCRLRFYLEFLGLSLGRVGIAIFSQPVETAYPSTQLASAYQEMTTKLWSSELLTSASSCLHRYQVSQILA